MPARLAMKFLTPTAVALAFAAPALAATAEPIKVRIQRTKVVLPIPNGFCRLRVSIPADVKALEPLRRARRGKGMIILAGFAPCKRLDAYRAGRSRIGAVGAYTMTADTKDVGMPRAKFTQEMATQFKQRASGKSGNGRNADTFVHRDDEAVYIAMSHTLRTKANVEGRRQVTIIGTTVLRRKKVSVSMTVDYADKKSVGRLLAWQRYIVRQAIAAN